MICPSVQDLSPTLHVASLANERVLRGCQEPIVENNKIEHVTKIGCAMVNMDKCAQSTPAAATEAQQQTHKTCIADVTDMCNWIDTSSREVSSRSLLTGSTPYLRWSWGKNQAPIWKDYYEPWESAFNSVAAYNSHRALGFRGPFRGLGV